MSDLNVWVCCQCKEGPYTHKHLSCSECEHIRDRSCEVHALDDSEEESKLSEEKLEELNTSWATIPSDMNPVQDAIGEEGTRVFGLELFRRGIPSGELPESDYEVDQYPRQHSPSDLSSIVKPYPGRRIFSQTPLQQAMSISTTDTPFFAGVQSLINQMNINDGEMEGRILRTYLPEEIGGYAVEADPIQSLQKYPLKQLDETAIKSDTIQPLQKDPLEEIDAVPVKDDLQLSLSSRHRVNPQEDDDGSDNESFRDSSYGTASVTSEAAPVSLLEKARECLLNVLLRDEELRALFISVPEGISSDTFDKIFRSMVSQFSKDLRKEAKNEREKGAAHFARISSGYFANQITSLFIDCKNSTTVEVRRLQDQFPQKRELLDRFLNSANQISSKGQAEDEVGSEMDDSSGDEATPQLPEISRLEMFVSKSQALKILRERLRRWLDSARSSGTAQGLNTKSEFSNDACQGGIGFAQSLLLEVKRFFRPKVAAMHKRLEWTCKCGKPMYGDYYSSDEAAMAIWAKELESIQYNGSLPKVLPSNTMFSPPRAESSGSVELQIQKSITEKGLAPRPTPVQNVTSSSIHHFGQWNAASSTAAVSSDKSTLTSPATEQFFELCVNTGELSIRLGEINISHLKNDAELFRAISTKYQEIRGFRARRILLKPRDVHFVMFGLKHRHQVGVYEKPVAIPPECEVSEGRYHYHECPMAVKPPMDYRTFLHYMTCHAQDGVVTHNDATFLRRLPKKLGCSIVSEGGPVDLAFGWGVHIIEGPNMVTLSCVVFVGLLLSFVVSVVYTIIAKTQEQGFSIGQWLLTVFMAAMSALYFHWSET